MATYITLTGAYRLPTGAAASGTVKFTLQPAVVVGTGGPILESSVTETLDNGGAFSVPLLANTDPTVVPAGSYYLVQEWIAGAEREYTIILPHDLGSPLDLASLAPAIPGPAQAAYVLQSVFTAHANAIASPTVLGHVKLDGTSITADPDGTIHGSGIGDKHYIHTQNTPATVWTITHNLAKHPAVTVVDSAGSVYQAAIEYPDLNTAIVRTTAAFSGLAYCN